MSEVKKDHHQSWFRTTVVYSLLIGVPLLGYIMNSPVLQNFTTVLLVFWTAIQALAVLIIGGGLLMAAVLDDHTKKMDLFEALTKRSPLFYVARCLGLFLALMLVYIGYAGYGTWFLFCWCVLGWFYHQSTDEYAKFKKNLV